MTTATTLPPPPPPPPKRLGILSQYTQFYHITLLFAIDTFLFLVLNFFSFSTNLQIYKCVCAKVAVHLKMTIYSAETMPLDLIWIPVKVCFRDAFARSIYSLREFQPSPASFWNSIPLPETVVAFLATQSENWNLHKWKWRLKFEFPSTLSNLSMTNFSLNLTIHADIVWK